MTAASRPIEVDYSELADPRADLGPRLAQAYGPDGLGILAVSGIPRLPELRAALLPLAAQFARLPDEAKARCEDPASRWNFGWSHGKESLEGSTPDMNKGSFYANPLLDTPQVDAELLERYPAYCRPNIWPGPTLPELEPAFKALGQLIIEVGLLLAAHCDAYCAKQGAAPVRSLRDSIAESPCPKGRLLHYFAVGGQGGDAAPAASSGVANAGTWCGWHLDHGSITGLCSAMLLDQQLQPVECAPDPQAGLYIRDRAGIIHRIVIPADHLALQMGEAMQVQSGGLLRATPHCVVAPRPELARGISRNTFAVFMQPHWDEPMDTPPGTDEQHIGVGQWAPGLTFGEFSVRTLRGYYSQDNV